MLLNLDISGRVAWVFDIKYILYSYGCGDVWVIQGTGNPELFSSREFMTMQHSIYIPI